MLKLVGKEYRYYGESRFMRMAPLPLASTGKDDTIWHTLVFVCLTEMTNKKYAMAAPEDGPGTNPKVGLEPAMGGCYRLA